MSEVLKSTMESKFCQRAENFASFARFIYAVASRKRLPQEMSKDQIKSFSKCSDKDANSILKDLDSLGVGRRIVGRRGGKTRIKWSKEVGMIKLASKVSSMVLMGESSSIPQTSKANILPSPIEPHTALLERARELLGAAMGVSPNAIMISMV